MTNQFESLKQLKNIASFAKGFGLASCMCERGEMILLRTFRLTLEVQFGFIS